MYALLIVLVLLCLFFTLPLWLPHAWYRKLMYPRGRPNWISRRLNAGSAWIFALGILPPFLLSLETKGRLTGQTYRIPLVAAELRGEWYLVSMLGENADWVRNVRAAGGQAELLRGKGAERVTLEEVPIAERAPILKEYLRRAPGARPHFDVPWTSPVRDFEPIAAAYPVFRIVAR
jgi:deazaflavin-dependent oxidoreductase (nitroreductase family)